MSLKKYFSLTLFFCSFLQFSLNGCMSQKKVVDPYYGRMERETALSAANNQNPESSAVPGSKTIQPVHSISMPGTQPDDNKLLESSQDVLLPLLTQINDRIFAYEEKKKQWNEFETRLSNLKIEAAQVDKINNCGWQLDNILSKYNGFHERLLEKKSARMAELLSGTSLLEIERLDIDFLEGECHDMLSGKQENNIGSMTEKQPDTISGMEKRISEAMLKRDYGQVIAEYELLPEEQRKLSSYEALIQYGQALVKSKRQDDALKLFENQLRNYTMQYNAKRDFELMQRVADLRFALGMYDGASQQYEQLNKVYTELGDTVEWSSQQLNVLGNKSQQQEEVDSYAALLGIHLGYDAGRDGFKVVMQAQEFLEKYPYSLVASSVDEILKKSKELAEVWFIGFLGEVDVLSFEEKFQDAALKLERLPKDILTEEKQELLKTKANDLLTAEAIVIERERLRIAQILPQKWNKGMEFLETKDYDGAIAIFRELLETEYAAKATLQIAETIQLAVREGRRRAAELFVRANRIHDLESRKKLLTASRRLLQEILKKYPESDLIDKVRRNLTRIEEEINTIDPALLVAAPESEEVFDGDTGESIEVNDDILIQDEVINPDQALDNVSQ
jgi:hypothetical protein